MEMLLTVVFASFFGIAAAFAAFVASVGPRDKSLEPKPDPIMAADSSRFFTTRTPAPVARPSEFPVEALVLQLENHVRLEQAAAESFLADPNAALLHSRTVSPFVN